MVEWQNGRMVEWQNYKQMREEYEKPKDNITNNNGYIGMRNELDLLTGGGKIS